MTQAWCHVAIVKRVQLIQLETLDFTTPDLWLPNISVLIQVDYGTKDGAWCTNACMTHLDCIKNRCTDTSDLRHFGPKTFRHHVFGAEVSQIFAVVPKYPLRYQCRNVSDTSAQKCMRHFGPRIKRRFECRMVFKKCRPVGPPYVRCSNVMEVLGKRLTVNEQSPVSATNIIGAEAEHCHRTEQRWDDVSADGSGRMLSPPTAIHRSPNIWRMCAKLGWI